jgi:hypothetical protein
MIFLAEIDRGKRFRVLAIGTRHSNGRERVPFWELRASLSQRCPNDLAQLDRLLAHTKEIGPPFASGKAKRLTDSALYELRTHRGTRVFWIYGPEKSVVLLHGYHKQGWEIPRHELRRAQVSACALAGADFRTLVAAAGHHHRAIRDRADLCATNHQQ